MSIWRVCMIRCKTIAQYLASLHTERTPNFSFFTFHLNTHVQRQHH